MDFGWARSHCHWQKIAVSRLQFSEDQYSFMDKCRERVDIVSLNIITVERDMYSTRNNISKILIALMSVDRYGTKQDSRGDKKSGDDALLWISSEIFRTNSQDCGYRKEYLLIES